MASPDLTFIWGILIPSNPANLLLFLFFSLFLLRNIARVLKSSEKDCSLLIIFKVEAERRACEEEENKASEEYIQKLLAEEEEEEKRQAEKRHREMEEQLKSDEELARRLSLDIVSFKKELWSMPITIALFDFEQSKEEAFTITETISDIFALPKTKLFWHVVIYLL